MATFRDPAARDRAWGRWYAQRGAAAAIRRTRERFIDYLRQPRRSGFRGCHAPTNAERRAAWAARFHLVQDQG